MKKPNWLKENEAANRFGYKPRTLRQHVKEGRLQIAYTNIHGRKYQYSEADIDKVLLDNSTFIR
jgi:predicted site-specific integrase-resolvase